MAEEKNPDPQVDDESLVRKPAGNLPKTQEELDELIEGRMARLKRAQKSTMEELEAKAAKYDQLEEAGKTELEKAQGQADAAKTELEKLKSKIAQDELRAQVAEDNGVPAKLITGKTLEEMEASVKLLKDYQKSSISPIVDTEGLDTGEDGFDPAAALAAAFGDK